MNYRVYYQKADEWPFGIRINDTLLLPTARHWHHRDRSSPHRVVITNQPLNNCQCRNYECGQNWNYHCTKCSCQCSRRSNGKIIQTPNKIHQMKAKSGRRRGKWMEWNGKTQVLQKFKVNLGRNLVQLSDQLTITSSPSHTSLITAAPQGTKTRDRFWFTTATIIAIKAPQD